MNKNSEIQRFNREKTITWAGIIAAIFLATLSLGGLLYAFLVPVP